METLTHRALEDVRIFKVLKLDTIRKKKKNPSCTKRCHNLQSVEVGHYTEEEEEPIVH